MKFTILQLKKITPFNVGVFGATYLPEESTFDETTGEGILKFDGDVTSIGSRAFETCSGLTSIEIPDSVTSIGHAAFISCSGLTSVIIPDSVTNKLGDFAFSSCSSLTFIEIPNGITSIERHAFNNCSSLTSITMGDKVTSIGNHAFADCSSLTSITCEAIVPPTCGSSAVFYNTNNCPIYVPAQSVEAYKVARNWSDEKARIQAIQ